MEESSDDPRVTSGTFGASHFSCKVLYALRARSRSNGSFPGFRTLLSDSEIPVWWATERNCTGKFDENEREHYSGNDSDTKYHSFPLQTLLKELESVEVSLAFPSWFRAYFVVLVATHVYRVSKFLKTL